MNKMAVIRLTNALSEYIATGTAWFDVVVVISDKKIRREDIGILKLRLAGLESLRVDTVVNFSVAEVNSAPEKLCGTSSALFVLACNPVAINNKALDVIRGSLANPKSAVYNPFLA